MTMHAKATTIPLTLKCLSPLRALSVLGLALSLALVGCSGGEKDASSQDAKPPIQEASSEKATADKAAAGQASSKTSSEARRVDTPADQAELARELAESRKQAQSKLQADGAKVDPEVEKRMKDPTYRKKKDDMLNQLSQVTTRYFKEGVEVRHTRKRPEWRLVVPKLTDVKDSAQRRQKAEELVKRFKGEIEPILDKPVDVIVFADTSESIQVY